MTANDSMLDVAIIGAGLCGLTIARDLQRQGRTFGLYEARDRIGGRVLSLGPTGDAMDLPQRADLGPTWFWPQTNPLFAQLVNELQLLPFPQYDDGDVLILKEVDKTPEAQISEQLHEGALRVAGGIASVTDALAAQLQAGVLHLEHALTDVIRHDDHIELKFTHGNVTVCARHVVLALPPRLIAECINFEPALDVDLLSAMQGTPTWMAAQAKAVLYYDAPSWRNAGHSGSAFVTHEQAVFKEIFDATGIDGQTAALGGFVALTPELRERFKTGLPMLMGNQMMQVFGSQLGEFGGQALVYHDWASDPYTASSLDLAEFGGDTGHPVGNPLLRQAAWDQNLHFAGSETAMYAEGYLEGALDAARRVVRDLAVLDANAGNAQALIAFRTWVRARQEEAFEDYRRRINQSLAVQQREQLTQRAMLETMESIFGAALSQLNTLPFDGADVTVEKGRSDLTPLVQSAFNGFIQKLLDEIVDFNRTSCALSNFPYEHRISKEYEQTILRDIAAAWREFSLDANALLINKRSATVHALQN